MASYEAGDIGQEVVRVSVKAMSQVSHVSQHNNHYPKREAIKPPFYILRRKYHEH